MDSNLFWFLTSIALGTYIQTTSGFALGLIVMGAVNLFHLVSVGEAAIVISTVALINNVLALRHRTHFIDRRLLWLLGAALTPAIVAGVWLLGYLTDHHATSIRQVLGWFILIGGGLLILNPSPRRSPAGAGTGLLAGALCGLFGGLFSTGGPPVVYHLYREPLSIDQIRATLFAVFMLSTVVRTVVVGVDGQIDTSVALLCLYSLPVVFITTLLAQRWHPPLSDRAYRRAAYVLLVLLSLPLILG